MASFSITRSFSINGTPKTVTETVSCDIVCDIVRVIAAETTNYEIDECIDVSNLVAAGITCDKEVTIKTNSTSAPDETIVLPAGCNLVWKSTDPIAGAKPFTVDVTKLYVTNAGATSANLQISLAKEAN